MVKPGKYRHYKGGIYVVLFTASHSDDGKPYVVYVNKTYGTYYVRSLKEFTSQVNVDSEDGSMPRFQYIDEDIKNIS